MKTIAILSDTHDHMDRIAAALREIENRKCEMLLHLGDFVAPFALKAVLKWDGPIKAILGNNDGERVGLKKAFPELGDGPTIWEIGGRKFGVAHWIEEIPSDYYSSCDVICSGHTHEKSIQAAVDGKPLIINPGEGCGWLTGNPSFAVLNLETLEAELVEFEQ